MILSFSCEESNNETCDLYEGRGNLISYELIAEFSEGAFKILIEDYYGFDASQFKIENSAKVYKIVYESIDTDGTPTELSGAIYVPQVSDERALPTLKTAHYTITERNAVASVSPNVSPQSILGSMQGYFSIYADGIGYGISYSQASYVNKQASAIAGIDLLRASKEFACENNIKLNNQLFTSGYSAGGYGTMAFHQVIDEEYSDEFTITAKGTGLDNNQTFDITGDSFGLGTKTITANGVYIKTEVGMTTYDGFTLIGVGTNDGTSKVADIQTAYGKITIAKKF